MVNSRKFKSLRTFLIITLCMILALGGCSSAKDEAATSYSSSSTASSSSGSYGGSSDSLAGVASGSTIDSAKTDSGSSYDVKTSSSTETASAYDVPASTAAPVASSSVDGYLGEERFSFKAEDSGSAEIYDSLEGTFYTDGDVPVECPPIEVEPIEVTPITQVSAGMLTAGEWNDNKNYDFLKNLISDGQSYEYSQFFTTWGLSPFSRIVVKCKYGDSPVNNAKVTVLDTNGNTIWNGYSDYEGMVYAYYALSGSDAIPMPTTVKAEYNGSTKEYTVQKDDLLEGAVIEIAFDQYSPKAKTLDLMFTIDTTGSMGDEIYYLQKELENVIKRVQNDTANIPVRLSVNFYRDEGDEYVVRPYEFSSDINTQLAYLNREYASGGGDYEEAVEQALASSVKHHEWDEDSIKIMFLVLDAPPHHTKDIVDSLYDTLANAAEKGIHIIPVASSGVDKDTEFLLRAFAMVTGGTYTFLTDDSGIGNSHLEPTVGEYTVEFLNDLLVRLIEQYIG